MPENHLPAHDTSDDRSNVVTPIGEDDGEESHLGKWLAMTALLSVTAWYTMVNPKWVPTWIAQTVKLSHTVSAETKKCASTSLNATTASGNSSAGRSVTSGAGATTQNPSAAHTGAAPAVAGRTDSRHGGHIALLPVSGGALPGNAGGGGGAASAAKMAPLAPVDNTKQGFTFITPEMPKAAEAKTSKASRKAGFMVPPPPPTPCVLPPGFAFLPIQQAAPKQAVQAAQPAPPANYSASTTGGAVGALYTENLLTLSGTIASGDTVSVTVYNASLSGGQQTASVTATSSSIATTLSALTTAINNNTALSAAGVMAIAGTSSSNITLLNTSNNVTSYAASATGSATVTLGDSI